jgi:hypothetical protein
VIDPLDSLAKIRKITAPHFIEDDVAHHLRGTQSLTGQKTAAVSSRSC